MNIVFSLLSPPSLIVVSRGVFFFWLCLLPLLLSFEPCLCDVFNLDIAPSQSLCGRWNCHRRRMICMNPLLAHQKKFESCEDDTGSTTSLQAQAVLVLGGPRSLLEPSTLSPQLQLKSNHGGRGDGYERSFVLNQYRYTTPEKIESSTICFFMHVHVYGRH